VEGGEFAVDIVKVIFSPAERAVKDETKEKKTKVSILHPETPP
jgi:hypothetical protein